MGAGGAVGISREALDAALSEVKGETSKSVDVVGDMTKKETTAAAADPAAAGPLDNCASGDVEMVTMSKSDDVKGPWDS